LLIIHYSTVNVKDVFQQGKDYPWPRLKKCPNCQGKRLWRQGYVPRYFAEFNGLCPIIPVKIEKRMTIVVK